MNRWFEQVYNQETTHQPQSYRIATSSITTLVLIFYVLHLEDNKEMGLHTSVNQLDTRFTACM